MRRLAAVALVLTIASGCSGGDHDDVATADVTASTSAPPTTVLTGDAAMLATADRACLATKTSLHDAAKAFYVEDQEPTPEQVQQFFREDVLPALRQQVTDLGALQLESTDLGGTLASVSARLDELEAMADEHPEQLRTDGRAVYEAMTSAYAAVGLPHCAST